MGKGGLSYLQFYIRYEKDTGLANNSSFCPLALIATLQYWILTALVKSLQLAWYATVLAVSVI